MYPILIFACAFGFLRTLTATAQTKTLNAAAVSQPLSPENIEALRAFKQLGFDDQHTSGRIRQSDIAVHHVYHDPNQVNSNFKPYLSSKYGTLSGDLSSSSSFQQSPYLMGQGQKKNQVGGIAPTWPNSASNGRINSGYPTQPRAHPNEILSNMGVQLPAEQILGKHFSAVSTVSKIVHFEHIKI